MSVRIATFNAENLMRRFDFTGFHNDQNMDRALLLYDIRDERQYRELEQARAIAQTDDMRQLTALAIADTNADILCLQEVDNIDVLKAFEHGYLFKMIGNGYRQKFLVEGNGHFSDFNDFLFERFVEVFFQVTQVFCQDQLVFQFTV